MKFAVGRTGVGKIVRVILFGALLILTERISERTGTSVVVYTLLAASGLIAVLNLVAFMLPPEQPIDRRVEPEFGEDFVTVFDPDVRESEKVLPREPARSSSVRAGTRDKQPA